MQCLYDSDNYVVVHMNANEVDQENLHNTGKPPRHGFEIVAKNENRELYLDGEWAVAFQAQMQMWQQNMPTQEEVENVLESYTQLGWLSLAIH